MAPRRTSPAIGACTNWSRPSTRSRTALIFGAERVSYGDLDARAEPARARAGRPRRGPGRDRGRAAGARDRAGGGGAGGAQGRRRVHGARPAVPGRAAGGRDAQAGVPLVVTTAELSGRVPGVAVGSCPAGRNRTAAVVAAPASRVDAGRRGVRDVHLRLDRAAEGRGGLAPRDGRHADRPGLRGLRRRTRCGCSARRCPGTRSRWSCSGPLLHGATCVLQPGPTPEPARHRRPDRRARRHHGAPLRQPAELPGRRVPGGVRRRAAGHDRRRGRLGGTPGRGCSTGTRSCGWSTATRRSRT